MKTKTSIQRQAIVVAFLLLCLPTLLLAQRDLRPVKDDATGLLEQLSNRQNKLERASLTTEDERRVTVSLTFRGFEDKAYKVRAFVLDNQKVAIQEISQAEAEMPSSKQLDLTFTLGDVGKRVTSTNLESKYLRIKVVANDGGGGLLTVLEDSMSGISLSPFDYLFELDKRWMLSGKNVVLNVKLTPYRNAATISQN